MNPIGRHPISTKGRMNAASVVIPNGTSTSPNIDLQTVPRDLVGIVMPAAWSAASLTFDVSADGTNFFPLHYAAGAYTKNAAAGAAASLAITLDPQAFWDWAFVRIRSGVIGAYVNQAAARTLVVLTRDV